MQSAIRSLGAGGLDRIIRYLVGVVRVFVFKMTTLGNVYNLDPSFHIST